MIDPTNLLRNVALNLRNTFSEHNIPRLHFEVVIEGGTDYGEISLTYRLSSDRYENHVESHNLDAALKEFIRQRSWKEINAPLMIGHDETNGGQTIDEVMEQREFAGDRL